MEYRLNSERLYQYIVAIIVFVAFLPKMFEFSILTGLGYIGAVVFSLYNRTLLKTPAMMVYILVGTILTYASSSLLPDIWKNFKGGDWISLIVLIWVYLMIYLKGYNMKKGIN